MLLCLGLALHLTFLSNSIKSSKRNCQSKIFSIIIFLIFCCEKGFAKLVLSLRKYMLMNFNFRYSISASLFAVVEHVKNKCWEMLIFREIAGL